MGREREERERGLREGTKGGSAKTKAYLRDPMET